MPATVVLGLAAKLRCAGCTLHFLVDDGGGPFRPRLNIGLHHALVAV
jgi:hypothetical protein